MELDVEKYNEMVKQEEACLFPKSYKCPICYEEFKSLAVRKAKMIAQGTDEDLRPHFKWVDPLKYEVVVCPVCGYGAMARYFDEMIPTWRKQLQQGLPSFAKDRSFIGGNRLTYSEALKQYDIAIQSDYLAAFKESRKAYTYLKRGWVIRGKLETESDFLSEDEIRDLRQEERGCLDRALEGYMKAFSEEKFPLSGMDEHTLTYLCAALASRLGKYKDAISLLSRLMGPSVNARIKDKAYDLKENVRERLKEIEAAERALQ